MTGPSSRGSSIRGFGSTRRLFRTHYILQRAWGRVRWRMIAIIAFTGASTILVACLGVAVLNVAVRRESANVVQKQIQVLVQASRSVAPAILDHASACDAEPADSGGLKPLLAYTDRAFPQAQTYLTVEDARGAQSLLPGPDPAGVKKPGWLAETAFAGLVVDGGQLEIRNIVVQQRGPCKVTAIFSLPLGPELAKRLSSAASMEVTAVSPTPIRVHSSSPAMLRTVERNFLPGMSRSSNVVLTVRNWETGALEDWIAYRVRDSYSSTFEDVLRFGSHLADWVWLLAALSVIVLILDASGVWMSIRFGNDIATVIDELSGSARQIARGNFAWRMPVRSKGQLGDLAYNFNEMAIALGRFQKEEAIRLRLESELQVARSVQEYLYPRVVPRLNGATTAGRTVAARIIGGDLYDFFSLGPERIGILCADVSGKGIPAALMMANLQAVARAQLGGKVAGMDVQPTLFVETLNQELAGRFGDNRYATLFWAQYDTRTGDLTYINAGQPPPILIRSSGAIERLNSDGFPVGMFANTRYTGSQVAMESGSRLIVFTDGLTDAQNSAEEEFGEERLIQHVRTIPAGIDAKGVADRLMDVVAEWSVGTERVDDTTVVVIDVDLA